MSPQGATGRPVVVTLTPNPSLDRTVDLAGPLVRGAVQRAVTGVVEPGGKGVNVARVVAAAGQPALAVLPADAEDPLLHALVEADVAHRAVPSGAPVRTNVAVTEPDGTTTKVNEAGPPMSAQVVADLCTALLEAAAGASWTVLCGSLPPGAPADLYAGLVAPLHAAGCAVAVDTSGPALAALLGGAAALGPQAAPDVVKPNGEELAELVGGDGEELERDPLAAARAARVLLRRGVGAVLATLGARGAVLVTAEGAWSAVPPPTTVRSTVGAGDSSLAGYLLAHARGARGPELLRSAVAFGAAAAALPGSTLPRPEQTRPDLVDVVDLDLADPRPPRAAPAP